MHKLGDIIEEHPTEKSTSLASLTEQETEKNGLKPLLKKKIEKKYEIVKLIGRGSYGHVHKAKCKATGNTVALKVMKLRDHCDYDLTKVIREI